MNDWIHRNPPGTLPSLSLGVTKDEFDALKEEVESLKKLLKAAKIYDDETGQPDCEIEEKMDMIKKYAESLGVDLDIE
jgi:hypothetical protein